MPVNVLIAFSIHVIFYLKHIILYGDAFLKKMTDVVLIKTSRVDIVQIPSLNKTLCLDSWEKIFYIQLEADLQSKISSICTNSEHMREIDQNVAQFDDL